MIKENLHREAESEGRETAKEAVMDGTLFVAAEISEVSPVWNEEIIDNQDSEGIFIPFNLIQLKSTSF